MKTEIITSSFEPATKILYYAYQRSTIYSIRLTLVKSKWRL